MSDERKPMTDEELAAIQGRLTKATPGPWVHGQNGGYVILGYKPEKKRIDGYGADDHVCVLDDGDHHQYRSEDEQLANAEFIANAPTDIARLLAEVEQLRKEHAWLLQEVAKTNRTPVYCPMPDRYECLYHVGDECRSKEDEMRVGCWRTAVEFAVKCGERNNAE